jgi:membrane protein DedA with SNARE-associated domain
MIFSIRFSPGLRVALSAACAYAGVSPWKFTLLNMASSIVWAASLLAIVAWAGPHWLGRLGISGWWGAAIPAVAILLALGVVHRLDLQAVKATGDNDDA